ncbi:MAG: hypothetical protein ACE37K_15045 [Planctomycetota bacterium]
MRRVAQMLLLLPFAACTYVDQRLTDLGDCFVWRWHQSALGANVDAKVGPLAVNVGGWYAEWGVGKDTWWQRPGYTLTNHGYGIPFTTLGPLGYGQSWSRFLATSTTGNHVEDPQGFDDVSSWILLSDVFDLDDSAPFALTPEQKVVDLFGVELGLTPVFVHAHVGFNVAEFVDFALGLLLIDVFGDDHVERPPTLPFVPEGR